MAPAEYLSGAWRLGLAAGYAALLAVNGIYGSGAFGVPTNADISGAYPSPVTPAGFTFAIWGPIFLLQGGGTALVAAGRAPALGSAVAGPWLAGWCFECAWQLVFASLPIPASDGDTATKLGILVPAAALLLSAFSSFLVAAARVAEAYGAASDAEKALLAAPTGINAAWLSAAAGIGLSLVLQLAAPALAGPRGAAALLALVLALAGYVVPRFVKRDRAPALGLAYAGAACWACFGVTRGDVPDAVRYVAHYGGIVLAVVAAAALSGSLALRPRPGKAPAAEPLKVEEDDAPKNALA